MFQFSTGKLSTHPSRTITTSPWGQTSVPCTSPMSADAEAAITASSQRSASLRTGHGRLTSISTSQTGAQPLYPKTARETQYFLSHGRRDSKLRVHRRICTKSCLAFLFSCRLNEQRAQQASRLCLCYSCMDMSNPQSRHDLH